MSAQRLVFGDPDSIAIRDAGLVRGTHGGSYSYWRVQAAPIIRRVLTETTGKSEREIRAALKAAYPFGPRKYHPYKIWLSEVKRQRGE